MSFQADPLHWASRCCIAGWQLDCGPLKDLSQITKLQNKLFSLTKDRVTYFVAKEEWYNHVSIFGKETGVKTMCVCVWFQAQVSTLKDKCATRHGFASCHGICARWGQDGTSMSLGSKETIIGHVPWSSVSPMCVREVVPPRNKLQLIIITQTWGCFSAQHDLGCLSSTLFNPRTMDCGSRSNLAIYPVFLLRSCRFCLR